MSTRILQRQFERIGARAVVRSEVPNITGDVSIDIGNDGDGEFFDIALRRRPNGDLRVVDTRPKQRHLLLMSEQSDGKHKFLCGHDERHWFVAAVPERMSVSNVKTAFEALKPVGVRAAETRKKVKPRRRNRRRNEAFVRQGEWFFVPIEVPVDERIVLRNEPIARGGGKPHVCEELVRQGGELVYVCPRYPNGLTEQQYRKKLSNQPKLRGLGWMPMRRNPGVFVRGRVRHADHATIRLDGWHKVLMNTENQSVAMRHVAFVD